MEMEVACVTEDIKNSLTFGNSKYTTFSVEKDRGTGFSFVFLFLCFVLLTG